jgi:hypothetical protein
MKLGIMQPYFLPYIGYFQLISSVDTFIVYDNIKFTKKGWINRNRMLVNGSEAVFSLPLCKGSDSSEVKERKLNANFDRRKLLNQFKGAYHHAPNFEKNLPLLEKIINFEDSNLFNYVYNSIQQMCVHLGIETEIKISSSILIDDNLKGQEKVLALCKATGANTYINTIGGKELYYIDDFRAIDVELQFIKPKNFEYKQFENPHLPWLSIIDVLMFNALDLVRDRIKNNFTLN